MALSTKRLGDLVLEAKPGFACGEEAEDGIFQIRMNNITRDGRLDLSKRRLVPSQRPGMVNFLLREGDVLFNATNSPDLVGKTALFNAIDGPTVFSNHFLRLRVDPSILLPAYLSRWLQLQFDRGTFKAMCRQWVNQATVGRDALLRLAVPLPSLAEQRRIAEALDRADDLRAKRREALAHLDELALGIFLDLFGSSETNPHGWPSIRLANVLGIPLRNGISPATRGEIEGYVLTLSSITGQQFNPTARKSATFLVPHSAAQVVHPADFFICRGNGNINLVGRGFFPLQAMPDTAFPDTIIAARVRTELVRPAFLEHVWRSAGVRRQIELSAHTTNGTYKVNQKGLGGISFFSPPLELQDRFTARVAAVDALRATYSSGLAELDALFASLQDRAFRGLL
ncbi:restriction endonuclease subunit S [Micromonospora sp. CPCC 206060]|uniref:restriction endonuclease subunit S n=1 Tax=Micromonospora sp. CPCC 206060 TaxID=3122406 RepID=UPI002FF31667